MKIARARTFLRTSALSITLALGLPMIEPAFVNAQPSVPVYSTNANPFEADDNIRRRADAAYRLGTTTYSRLNSLFSAFSVRSPYGSITVVQNNLRPPRSASAALRMGGDCSEIIQPVISAILYLNRTYNAGIVGGVKILHFDNSPQNLFHEVVYLRLRGREILFDPQAQRLGQLFITTSYRVVRTLSFDQSEYIFHSEWGDYFSSQRDYVHAIIAYRRAITFYSQDPTLNRNLDAAEAAN